LHARQATRLGGVQAGECGTNGQRTDNASMSIAGTEDGVNRTRGDADQSVSIINWRFRRPAATRTGDRHPPASSVKVGTGRSERRSKSSFMRWPESWLWIAFWIAVAALLFVGWTMLDSSNRVYPVPTLITLRTGAGCGVDQMDPAM
jgi:hypothetical protein